MANKARGGTPVLILTVAGRTSGKRFSNLRATDSASVELRDGSRDVTVRVLDGAERDEAFAQVLRENPGFGGYETKAGRPMPVALLTPR